MFGRSRELLAPAGTQESRRPAFRRAGLLTLLAVVALAATPGVAAADGPTAPVATDYLARLHHVPAGLDAKIVDGYLRMWLRVPARETVLVLDYRGAPYLRFSRAGVAVNETSEMYYLNQTPVANTPPTNLTGSTPPRWHSISTEHTYEWHDGRLNGLATLALAPGQTYVGRWSIALLIDGHLTAITGGLWHAGNPSIVWFWPIAVLLLCVLAAWRVGSATLDARIARAISVPAVAGLALAAITLGFHGRPAVSITKYVELSLLLIYAAWALWRVLLAQPGYFTYLVIGFVAFWEGIELIQTLLSPFVLLALSPLLTRFATVLCLGCGAALILVSFRLADEADRLPAVLRRGGGEPRDSEHIREAYGVR
jgi:hypothetical protein